MSKIFIIGAYDRHNYGDLLFPIIVNKVLSTKKNGKIQIEYFSILRSDMTRYGGVVTGSIKDLSERNVDSEVVLMVAGGDVLGSSWVRILGFLMSKKMQLVFKVLDRFMPYQLINFLMRKFFNLNSYFPFVYSKADFLGSNPSIIYNAVGGSNLRDLHLPIRKKIGERIRDASYISVRDSKTKLYLEELNDFKVNLSPDSAVVMSDFFKRGFLKENLERELGVYLEGKPKYFCFQSALHYSKNSIGIIVNQLILIANEGYDILLLPIGKASGHEDDLLMKKILNRIYGRIGERFKFFDKADSIYDIMACIAFSRVFAGTSLHGCITAISYNIPHFSLCKIRKLIDFQHDWEIDGQPKGIGYDEMHLAFLKSLDVGLEGLQKKSEELKKLCYQNFDEMFKIGLNID